MIRVMIVDDEPLVRRGLTMRLKLVPDIQIVGEACDGVDALECAQELKPDVIVMDVSMPRLDGIQATEALHELAPHTGVVILTLHADQATQVRAEAAGAAAFLAKGSGEQNLIAAIRQAASQVGNGQVSNMPGNNGTQLRDPRSGSIHTDSHSYK